jgi:hypothetical protein
VRRKQTRSESIPLVGRNGEQGLILRRRLASRARVTTFALVLALAMSLGVPLVRAQEARSGKDGQAASSKDPAVNKESADSLLGATRPRWASPNQKQTEQPTSGDQSIAENRIVLTSDGPGDPSQASPAPLIAPVRESAVTGSLKLESGSAASQPAANPLGSMKPPQSGDSHRQGVFDVYLMVEYRRDEIKFSGKPTTTDIFPGPVQVFFPPDQPFAFIPGAFQPSDSQLTGYGSVRVKDYGFDWLRLSTQVSFRYWGDLNANTEASPYTGQLDSFRGRRVLEPLTFYTDASGFMSDDHQVKFNVRLGRQYVYGAESVRMDGGTLTINHPRFSMDLFGGRRTTFFSDPFERGVAGGNFEVRATPRTQLKYEFLHYIDNSNRFQVTQSLGESWILSGNFFLLNTSPVDLGVDAHYLPPDGKTRVIFSFLEKLTSDDFIYDYTYRALAKNPENQIFLKLFPIPPTGIPLDGAGRLNLFQINPYTQFYVDAYRNLTRKIGVGGTFWVRHVNDSKDAGPFDTSFQEYRANADWFPSSLFELGAEYRFRNVSRENPDNAVLFTDINQEGETKFHEVYANGAFHLFDNRLTLESGLFYRRFSTQSRLLSFDGLDTTGFTGAIKWRINRNYKVLLEYGIDSPIPFFNPDIDYTQSFRVRFEWRFAR